MEGVPINFAVYTCVPDWILQTSINPNEPLTFPTEVPFFQFYRGPSTPHGWARHLENDFLAGGGNHHLWHKSPAHLRNAISPIGPKWVLNLSIRPFSILDPFIGPSIEK